MSQKPPTSFELGRRSSDLAPSSSSGGGEGDVSPAAGTSASASDDHRPKTTATRYATSCKDLAIVSLRCQEKLAPGTSRNPCAVEINAYRACIEEEAERIKAAKYGPKKKGDIF